MPGASRSSVSHAGVAPELDACFATLDLQSLAADAQAAQVA